MKKNRGILVWIHPDLAKAGADLLGDHIGLVGLENSAVAAQEIENEQIGDRGAIREAPCFDPGHPSVGDLPTELGKQPRLADPGLTDEANRLAMPCRRKLFKIASSLSRLTKTAVREDGDSRSPERRWETPSKR